jgi:hypothetical protein
VIARDVLHTHDNASVPAGGWQYADGFPAHPCFLFCLAFAAIFAPTIVFRRSAFIHAQGDSNSDRHPTLLNAKQAGRGTLPRHSPDTPILFRRLIRTLNIDRRAFRFRSTITTHGDDIA